jgi:hypothetical protein
MEALPVRLVFFQTGITIPGICTTETNTDKILGHKLEMTLTEGGLLMQAVNDKGEKVNAWVPSANIKTAMLK